MFSATSLLRENKHLMNEIDIGSHIKEGQEFLHIYGNKTLRKAKLNRQIFASSNDRLSIVNRIISK